MNPTTHSIGVLNTGRPPQIVPIQQNSCTPVGMAMAMLAAV